MKKVYHLLSVALLGAMALTSCEEDKIVNENNGEGNETDKNLTDYSFIASIKQSAPLGRSNLQNGDIYSDWKNSRTGSYYLYGCHRGCD